MQDNQLASLSALEDAFGGALPGLTRYPEVKEPLSVLFCVQVILIGVNPGVLSRAHRCKITSLRRCWSSKRHLAARSRFGLPTIFVCFEVFVY